MEKVERGVGFALSPLCVIEQVCGQYRHSSAAAAMGSRERQDMITPAYKSKVEQDEISQVIGSPIYGSPYYFDELRARIQNVHSTDLIPVSRFYIGARPPTVVDFEPEQPKPFYCEEKRKFFMEKGIVYIPIFLGQYLHKEQFAELVKKEREVLTRGYRDILEDQALLKRQDDPIFNDPEWLIYIDREALKRLKAKKLKGVAAKKHLPHLKAQIIAELRTKLKNGSLERSGRDNSPALAIG